MNPWRETEKMAKRIKKIWTNEVHVKTRRRLINKTYMSVKNKNKNTVKKLWEKSWSKKFGTADNNFFILNFRF